MSSDICIQVSDLSKCYQIYTQPQDRLKQSLWRGRKNFYKEFWALKNISFEVAKGETVGIIGRNGSGKSSLLQLICGILSPSGGVIDVKGRVAALLELGAGFNLEFTGRENVFLNASILGMMRKETEERFDEIVSFAELTEFIDQPVKTYSSGMYLRLAFAVAINVDPDILVIDEALAVGDEVFQRKCFSKIQMIQKRGGTILFVSHSATTVVELCNKAILLEKGELLLIGKPKMVVSKYHKLIYAPAEKLESLREEIKQLNQDTAESEQNSNHSSKKDKEKPQEFFDPNLKPKSTLPYESKGALIEDVKLTSLEGKEVNVLVRKNCYLLNYTVNFQEEAFSVRCGTLIKTLSGFELGGMLSHSIAKGIERVVPGEKLIIQFKFNCILIPGTYFFNVGVVGIKDGVETYLHRIIDAGVFRVQPENDLLVSGVVDFSFD